MFTMNDLTFHVVTANRWNDLQTLFGPNGAYSGCWCMYLRESAKEFDANCPKGGAANKARLKAIVDRGGEPGLIAYDHATPVGWVSVAPREHYVRVLRSPLHKPFDDAEKVWSIACFFIAKAARGQGVADRLLAAALAHASQRGARTIEAYPIDTDSRQPDPEMWRGSLQQFLKAGFHVALRRKPARPIVRKVLDKTPRRL